LREVLTDIKDLAISEGFFSAQANYGNNNETRLVRINDSENSLKTINLTELPRLKQLKLIYSETKKPSLTSLTIKNCANSLLYFEKTDLSCL